jgi:type II secretory pathway component GspD/PulD (secretin)
LQVNSNIPADNPPYFELGLGLELTPTVFPNRNIALSSRSIFQIRRGPPPAGGVPPVVFETQPIRNDIQIPEGKTILLGGFLKPSNSAGLPSVPASPDNAIVSMFLVEARGKELRWVC